ncbi:CocE/NonD family hydrolase [Nakamurella sp. YIM 132087]|uniref:CocE/NonD family hydrolase n=1 Tax=Nakamurella alba TaxID=2665158 RepID=A0A7K1FHN0_9ACTN|nr:CocE/NonD family hydrolase [Nakamurella alba]MTD13576.1 CocE/NonD family hydrolase [Nakamurella alba]
MTRSADAPISPSTSVMSPERPWRRPGAARYAMARLRGLRRPQVTVYEAPRVVVDNDLPIPTRDGTVLRANVYRPQGAGPWPVIVCAHPYGKDNLPARGRNGWRLPPQYRMMRQTSPVRISQYTSWEAPDPAYWTDHGYVVVNADLRGSGTSEGVGTLLSAQEGRDVADIIQWASEQPWSTGSVGMIGVSYLAITQYSGAAERPDALRCIVPWEGFTDPYRDLMRPGGVRENGFLKLWTALMTASETVNLEKAARIHPTRDDWWTSLVRDISNIQVPVLLCTSFSDNNLHSRGTFRAFETVSSTDRFAWTHRSGKWSTFYSDEAKEAQLAFFDHFLADRAPRPDLPAVRLEVRDSRDTVTVVRREDAWPLARTLWTPWYLDNGRLGDHPSTHAGTARFDLRRQGLSFRRTLGRDLELTGAMALRIWIELDGTTDADLYVGVEKWRNGRYVPFEGSYGFGRDRVTTGWQRVSMRELDEEKSRPGRPEHTFDRPQPMTTGEVVPVDVALGPSATSFRSGDEIRLVIAGRWLWPSNPLTGQFPAHYARGPRGRATLHWGPERPAALTVPVIPSSEF